jgi:hypothetical protein
MKIDIDRLTEADLIDLNNWIVARLRFLREMRAHAEMLDDCKAFRPRFRTLDPEVSLKQTTTIDEKRYFAMLDGAVAVLPTVRFTSRGTFSIVNSIRRSTTAFKSLVSAYTRSCSSAEVPRSRIV